MGEAARVLVLGHGAVGCAMERLLGARHGVTAWDRDLDTGEETVELESVAADPDFILFAVPANPHRELARRVAAVMPSHCICLSSAKGLDEDGRAPYQVLAAELGERGRHGAICGPMIARDLQQGRAGFAMLGTAANEDFAQAAALFAGTPLALEHSTDEAGVSWAVILKNVYVPLIGAADALELGDNVRGFLVCAILSELDQLVCRLGGRAGTAYTVAGLGDLVTTATSPASHHRRIGSDLASGRTDRMAGSGKYIRSEGVHTLSMIERHGLLPIAEFPLMALMQALLAEPGTAGERLRHELEHWGH
ncbi:MAG: NAD(P)H-dependent glycerol-3-phosphate dehydrogenase [Halofilum sp. (in: g-proteobacteria)]|nr:NAD(P)H-dependent glycerol-3-phosphate dehydrogenase [Halofilum sp. (in: g-proteobacteria)]